MANMTKVAKFTAIANALEAQGITFEDFDAQAFLAKEIETTNKKNAHKSTTPTKTQKENEEIKGKIVALLADREDGMTAGEVATALGLSSPQKASALLKQLCDSGKVSKAKVGKRIEFASV